MAKMIDAKPSYKGEGKVWEKLNELLPDDMVVYNQREINGREYDFCVMAKNLGILIIEVKGWLSDQIVVRGIDHIEIEGYDKPQSSPKKQARAYRFAILNKISAKYNASPLVLDLVCYPFISKEEYNNIHLNIVSEETYTLFQEDLEDRDSLITKITNIFRMNSVIPHSDFSCDLMLKIRRDLEPDLKEMAVESRILPYSKLYIIPNSLSMVEKDELMKDYFSGVKSIIFVGDHMDYETIMRDLNDTLKSRNIDYDRNNMHVGYLKGVPFDHDERCFKIFNFELYYIKLLPEICSRKFIVKEGKTSSQEYEILRNLSACTAFNLQQYEVEHASEKQDLLIEAGAGTGKTFSMVSRIAYLCNKEEASVTNIAEEIAMVTFTNDAAGNMKRRLKQMFLNYFVLTGNEKYLKYVEDIDRSNISTIHKFAIEILRNESIYTGLGTNFKVSSNEYERGKSYDVFLGIFLEEREAENPNFANELSVPVYELKKTLMKIADKLLDKSVNLQQIKSSEMGVTVDDGVPYFNDLLIKVVFPAEATYLEVMKNGNKVELKQSLAELGKVLSGGCRKLEECHFKYLFIDEFQDTDDFQIEVFQTLQKIINTDCKLFVVGDLKQSIYRFRGAKLNAFQKLQNRKKREWGHYRLNRNYRTDGRLLNIFDQIFANMGDQKILPYSGKTDQLRSDVLSDTQDDELFVSLPCHGKNDEKILELLNETILIEKGKIEKLMQKKSLSKEERTIAILVRSNWQVKRIVSAAAEKNILVETKTGGDLFQLPSTLDLYKLVLAAGHSTNPVYLVNFIESNYTNLKLDYQKLYSLTEEEKLGELTRILDEYLERRMGLNWGGVLNEIYTQPVLYVLKKIFDALQPWEIYSQVRDKKRRYIANYEYLLEKIIQFLRIDTLTLNQIAEYLGINILTGQQQLSRSIGEDDEGIHVICTTVHKSKGLEYGAVILPYTYEDISDIKKVKLEANYSDHSLSYTVLFENKIRERNSNYSEDKEVSEQIAEEARILYVALTRAIRKCIWINNVDCRAQISWATLLEG